MGSPFYNLAANDIKGSKVEFSQLEGKVVLAVNVASHCGYTDGHYRGLQRLHDILGNSGKLEILGFPCNQFGAQEPGTPEEIADIFDAVEATIHDADLVPQVESPLTHMEL